MTSPFEKIKTTPDTERELQESEATVFRSAVMRLGFLALDRPDIQFRSERSGKRHGETNCEKPTHAEEMCKVPSTSEKLDMVLCSSTISAVYPGEVGYRLGRMPTYPTKHKRHIGTFRTAHLILQQHNASACLSLSSGEAETYGVTKAFSRAIGMRNLANDLGFERYGELSLEVQTDSSAALAICQRRGCGRIRHLDNYRTMFESRIFAGRE